MNTCKIQDGGLDRATKQQSLNDFGLQCNHDVFESRERERIAHLEDMAELLPPDFTVLSTLDTALKVI